MIYIYPLLLIVAIIKLKNHTKNVIVAYVAVNLISLALLVDSMLGSTTESFNGEEPALGQITGEYNEKLLAIFAVAALVINLYVIFAKSKKSSKP